MSNLTPLMQVRTAKSLWLMTLYICNGIQKGKIPPKLFDEPLTLTADGETIAVITPKWEIGNPYDMADNLQQGVLGICCIALDSALDATFGSKPSSYSNSDIDALRVIVYMIRCAFAHEPTLPTWNVKPKHHRRFSIDKISLEMDFTQLNGEVLAPAHHGGWRGLLMLMDYCEEVINQHGKKNQY